MPDVQVTLLGGASLFSGERRVERMERKSAALVAYLALSGTTVRTRIAGLLWPESRERTARNNLAQVVKRLRDAAGTNVVEGTASIAIAPGVDVDVARLELLAQRGHHGDVADNRGILLDGFDYDDCSELDAWLASQRERLRRAVKRARTAEAARLEREGRFEEALTRSRADVDADPLDEEAARRRMRLLYRSGDAAEALRTFEALKSKLSSELGAQPHAETASLAGSIRAGTKEIAEEKPPPSSRMSAPLVGRADDWNALENAWKRRAGVLVVGSPGIGKSRLVREFASSKGIVTEIGGRPGDGNVPYATVARFFRQLVDRYASSLAPWAKTELARLVPSLGTPPEGTIDKLRFFEAMTEALRIAVSRGMSILCLDDLQFVDAASLEALEHALAGFWSGEIPGLRTILAARKSMDTALDARLRVAESAGLLVRVVLEPLDEASVKALLMNEPALIERAAEVHAISGGNPFFALEIVKGVRSGELDPNASLAKGKRATELVAQRLEPLSSTALRLLRVGAIAGPSFDLDLAADVLEMHAIDLAESLEELAEAQVFENQRFVHDLLQEIVDAQMPAAVREFVHARVAARLVARGDEPARAAHHWLAAGKPAEAAPLFVKAGDRAQQISRLAEAGEFYERAANLFEAQGDRTSAFRAIGELRRLVRQLGNVMPHILDRLEELATTDGEHARAKLARASRAFGHGNARLADEISAAAATHAAQDPWAEIELHHLRSVIALEYNDVERAIREQSALMQSVTRVVHYEIQATGLWVLAEISRQRDLFRDAIARYEETIRDAESRVQRHWARGRFFAYLARCHLSLGDAERARSLFVDAVANATHFEQGSMSLREIDAIRTRFEIAVGDLDTAAKLAAALVAAVPKEAEHAPTRASGFHRLALIALTAERTKDAQKFLALAAKETAGLPSTHARTLVLRSIAGDVAKKDIEYVRKFGTPLDAVRMEMRATRKPAKAALAACEAAVKEIESFEARGYLAEAVARRAAAKLAMKDRKGAAADIELARTLADAHPPVDFSRGLLDALLGDELNAEKWKTRAAAALDVLEKA